MFPRSPPTSFRFGPKPSPTLPFPSVQRAASARSAGYVMPLNPSDLLLHPLRSTAVASPILRGIGFAFSIIIRARRGRPVRRPFSRPRISPVFGLFSGGERAAQLPLLRNPASLDPGNTSVRLGSPRNEFPSTPGHCDAPGRCTKTSMCACPSHAAGQQRCHALRHANPFQ